MDGPPPQLPPGADANIGHRVLTLIWVEFGITVPFVVTRLITRARVVRSLGWDDWTMLFAMVCDFYRCSVAQDFLIAGPGVVSRDKHRRLNSSTLWTRTAHLRSQHVSNHEEHQDRQNQPAVQYIQRVFCQNFRRAAAETHDAPEQDAGVLSLFHHRQSLTCEHHLERGDICSVQTSVGALEPR